MSIENKLNKLSQTKAEIKSAIESKGQTVGDIPFAKYPDKIMAIESGGGGGGSEGCSPEDKIEVTQRIFGDEDCVLAIDGYNCDRGNYIGASKCVVVPVDFNRLRFRQSEVKKVIVMDRFLSEMDRMFEGLKSQSLNLLNFNTSSVMSMESMFRNSQVTELDLSSFDTSYAMDMSYMFKDSQARKLVLSSFDTSRVYDMEGMFMSSKAAYLDLSSFVTSSSTMMDDMFYEAMASVIYARTEEDADRFRDFMANPDGIPVVVKSDLVTKNAKLANIHFESHNEFDNEEVSFVGYKDNGDHLEAVYTFKFSDNKGLEDVEEFKEGERKPVISLMRSPSLEDTKASTIKIKLEENLEVDNDSLEIEVTSQNKLVNLHGDYNELEINSINESRGLLKVKISKDNLEL